MKKIYQFCLGFIILLFSSCVSDEIASTGALTGIIKDGSTNQPLQGCLITLSPTGKTVSTGSDGLYSFSDLQPEQYSIEVRKNGYESEKKETTLTAGNTNKVDIFLTKEKMRLSVTPELLNFGDLETSKDLFISNKIEQTSISYTIKANAGWISLSSESGIVSSNTNKIKVVIDRDVLSIGEYEKSLRITSSLGDIDVPIIVKQVEKSIARVGLGEFENITEISFSVKGVIHSTGGLKITRYGHCWSESELPTLEVSSKTNLGDTQEIGNYTSQITQLTTGNTYYVRAYAVNSKGVAYSEQGLVTMPKIDSPIVKTENATDITAEKAALHGSVLSDGGSDVAEYGFYYGTTENPTTRKVVQENGKSNFKMDLTDLSSGVIYYYKAFAVNSKGESCGEILNFKTYDESPTVETLPVKDLTKNSVILQGNILHSEYNITECGFYYGTVDNPTIRNQANKNAVGMMAVSLVNLKKGVTYYYKAYAVNSKGTSYGEVLNFTTKEDPVIETNYSFVDYNPLRSELSILLTASIVDLKGYKIKEQGFLYHHDWYPEITNSFYYRKQACELIENKMTGKFSQISFKENVTVRAYVLLENNEYAYGDVIHITTPGR